MTDLPLDNTIIVRLAPEMMIKAPGTRKKFQRILRENMARALKIHKIKYDIDMHNGRYLVHTDCQKEAMDVLSRVYGISTYSYIEARAQGSLEDIAKVAIETYKDQLAGRSFAVRAKNYGQKIYRALDLEREIGAALHPYADRVDLKRPEVKVRLDVYGDKVQFHAFTKRGTGGYPLGSQGKALCLISGGYDSVVAAWQLMRRGVCVDFVFCNLAGAAYERMVLQVTKALTDYWCYGYRPKFYVVDFAKVIDEFQTKTDAEFWQVILKRQMYRAAEGVSRQLHSQALITGEALGQVSSQTLSNLNTIDEVVNLPVLRPLIAFDKADIIDLATKIGTARLSERIPEYCALNKKNPATVSGRRAMEGTEAPLDQSILAAAIETAKVYDLHHVSDKDIAQSSVFVDEIPAGARVIDLQLEHLYDDWHVEGAENLSPARLMHSPEQLQKGQTYVLYCPFGTQSAVIAEQLQDLGYEAYSFRGGINELRKYLG